MPNIHGSLNLVSCEHPNADSSLPDVVDSFADLFLQLVLDGRGANEIKLYL